LSAHSTYENIIGTFVKNKPFGRTAVPAPQGNGYARGNKGGGRKTRYKPEYAEQAQKLCEIGLTDEQLATFFSVTDRTINRWKHRHEEFLSAVQAGKAIADRVVERAVLHGITGYYVEEETTSRGIVRKTKKWIPGNPGAGLRWLSLRCPEEWREKKEPERNHTLHKGLRAAMEEMRGRRTEQAKHAKAEAA
jgi:hypothetical protein